MNTQLLKTGTLVILIGLMIQGCGGGGGAAAPDVEPGPVSANGNTPGPEPIQPAQTANTYITSEGIIATINDVAVDGGRPVLSLSIVDNRGIAVTGLATGNVRFTIAKLIPGSAGGSAHWQSYINRLKTPAVVPENAPAIQATSEAGGSLVDHGDGSYTYTFITNITNVTQPLAVEYEPLLTHRVAIQFSGGPVANPTYDWVPATGQTSALLTNDVVATASCNTCHDPLALHGGGRQEIKYCVTCHNPGTTEPNSQTDMDLKVLVHRIHRGNALPSVQAGGEYLVYGFRDSLHDYSHVNYPQNIANCTTCHAGTATVSPTGTQVITGEGDNWAEVPTMSACGSCHDDVDFTTHFGGQQDNSGCLSCHSVSGDPGSVANSHRDLIREAMDAFQVDIVSVEDTAPGQFPRITFSVTNPQQDGRAYVLGSDPEWQGARLSAGVAIDTRDFNNTGLGTGLPSYAQTNALTSSVANGDGTYTVTSAVPIPDGTQPPGRAASGSGMVTIEGRARKDIDPGAATNVQNIPFIQPHRFFSIDQANGLPAPRRSVVDIEKCNACHSVKINHGSNRTNNITACAGCHNPRNTDRSVRARAVNPPTDGKTEETLDFKVLIHGIHAADYREKPLQVVGFGGFSTHVFDELEVQYPGRLSNCGTCHTGESFQLPLASGVLATTIDTGTNQADPSDDVMVTPAGAVCSSCHDSQLSRAHMEQNGADFSATQASIESGMRTETCAICHGSGRPADVSVVHELE